MENEINKKNDSLEDDSKEKTINKELEMTSIDVEQPKISDDASINPKNPENTNLEEDTKIDDIINHCSIFSKFNLKIYLIVLLVLTADGAEATVVSFLLTVLDVEWQFTTFEKSLFGICGSVGALFGLALAGTWSDIYGRKPIFILGNFIAGVFAIITAFTQNLPQYAISRIIYGFGKGITIAAASSLTTEITSKKLRAWMLNIIWVFYPIGELYCAIMADYFFVVSKEGKSEAEIASESLDPWRKLVLCVAAPCLISGLLSIFINESPRFLLSKQNYPEAFKSINTLLQSNKKNCLTEEEKNQLIEENKKIITQEKANFMNNMKEIFGKDFLKITLLISGMYYVTATSWSGLSLIMPKVIQMKEKIDFEQTKDSIDEHAAYTSFIISAVFEIPITLLSSLFAEIKFLGRKGALMLSFLLCFIPSLLSSINIPGFTAYIIVIRFMTTLPYGVIYIYNNEVYPTKIRSTALGITGAFSRVSEIFCPFIMFFLLDIGILAPFIFMSIIFACGILFSYLLPYESHGKNIK